MGIKTAPHGGGSDGSGGGTVDMGSRTVKPP